MAAFCLIAVWGNLYGAAYEGAMELESIAVATEHELLICDPSGIRQRIARPNPGWIATISMDDRGVMLCEYADMHTYDECFASWFPAGSSESAWQQPELHASVVGFFGATPLLLTDCIAFSNQPGIVLLDIDTGETRLERGQQERMMGGGRTSGSDAILLYQFYRDYASSEWQLLDSSSLQSTVLPAELASLGEPELIGGRMLTRTSTWGWDPQSFNGSNGIFSLEIDAQGQPIPGELHVVAAPDSHSDLANRFIASQAPVSDDELMGDLVELGANAVLRVSEACSAEQHSQLVALQSAILYMSKMHDEKDWESFSDWRKLARVTLQDKAGVELVPLLGKLLGDEAASPFHGTYRQLIAECDCPEAAALLGRAEFLGHQAGHRPHDMPFELGQQETYYTDLGGQKHNDTSWVECSAPDGARFVAYTASGLNIERDIYIAVDADNDGFYKECLATPFADVFEQYSFPGGAYDLGKEQDLVLSWQEDGLLLEYNTLVPGGPATDEDGDGEPDEWIQPVVQHESQVLELTGLRQDSDGDGLTDILEARLLCDPHSVDSDGDGLPDAEDPTPNVDPAEMGAVERGIARALDLFVDDRSVSGYFADMWDYDASGHPLRAVYLDIYGAGPVAFANNANGIGVSISTDEHRAAFDEFNPGFPAFSKWELSWQDRTRPVWEQLLGQRYIQFYKDELEGMSEVELDQYAIERGYVQLDSNDPDAQLYTLSIDLSWLGYEVQMILIDGEYYPVLAHQTWIS